MLTDFSGLSSDLIHPSDSGMIERIAILGGIDVGFVCQSQPKDVYQRSVAMLERVAERGGYALGTGNSVPAMCRT